MAMLCRGSSGLTKTLSQHCNSCLDKLKKISLKGAEYKVPRCHVHSSCRSTQHVSLSCSQSQTVGAVVEKPWRLASAVCLERFPVVSEEMNETEQRYFDMISAMELESSALSQHELSVAADRRRMARKQSGEEGEEEEGDGGDLLTALDLEDLATEELVRFKTAPRETDADEKNDRHSLDRQLTNKLVLLIKCQVGDKSSWILPHGFREEGETMRDAAERTLSEHASGEGSLQALFMGNAPVGFFKQRYPQTVQNETGNSGVKVFFFKAQYMMGEFQKADESATVEDYMWVTRDELDQYLEPSYLDSVKKFILPL